MNAPAPLPPEPTASVRVLFVAILNQKDVAMNRLIVFVAAFALAMPVFAQTRSKGLTGNLHPVNAFGEGVTGVVLLTPRNGMLEIRLEAAGVPPGMHLTHFHGFVVADPRNARCPTQAADVNEDGYIDLIETREVAGITMIPLTADPVSLEIDSDSYPRAEEDGRIRYEKTVEIAALRQAVREKFDTPLVLERRVLFMHGAPANTELPDSVQSLEGVPARITIPIACAELGSAE